MLRSLAFVSVGQQHDEAREQIPLIFAGRDELIDDDLCAVGEIAELRFPQHERFRVIAAETVLKADDSCFRERRIVNLEPRRRFRQMLQRIFGWLVPSG